MSLLCSKGQKKKKGKGPRDRSPAYGSKGEEVSWPSEENTKLIRQTERLKQLEEEKRQLEETLRDEKNKSRESKQEVANLKDQLHKLKKQHDSVKVAETPLGSVLPLANDKDSLEKEKQALETEIQNLKSAKEKELADIKAMKYEEMENSHTAAEVLDNNPNVSDLSDPNRPQKLGELFAQIYDDQWTDATEALEKLEKNEEDILNTLLDILEVVYTHCKEAAENQLSRIEEDLFLPPLENSSFESPDTNGTEHLKSPTTSKHSLSKIPRFRSQKDRAALPNISSEKKTVTSINCYSNGEQCRSLSDCTDVQADLGLHWSQTEAIASSRESDNHGTKDKDKPKRSLSFPKVKGEKMPEIPTEVKKGIKEYRKKVTKQVWPVIEKEVLSKLRKEFEGSVIEACNAYITKCVELCWLMRVQDPPVVLSWKVPDDKTFNTDVYRAYTKNGSHVEYVVWPIMYLHEDGPILMKGVAQGIKL